MLMLYKARNCNFFSQRNCKIKLKKGFQSEVSWNSRLVSRHTLACKPTQIGHLLSILKFLILRFNNYINIWLKESITLIQKTLKISNSFLLLSLTSVSMGSSLQLSEDTHTHTTTPPMTNVLSVHQDLSVFVSCSSNIWA